LRNFDFPLLHIDIHGKYNRKDNSDMDLGISSLIVHFKSEEDASFAMGLSAYLTEAFNNCFKGRLFNKIEARCEPECYLSGYWGGGVYTMTE